MSPTLADGGVLPVDKPAGATSFAVVRALRVMLRERRIGHTGTLDPMATGLLLICFGEGTKIAQFLLDMDKEYEAELTLGSRTDTGDATGRVVRVSPVIGVTEPRIKETCQGVIGVHQQVPPMYSAVHHHGRRLYELARGGQEVARRPRRIRVHEFRCLKSGGGKITFHVRCSSGTYIRSLGEELARRLGTEGHLTALRRTRIGSFGIEQAIPVSSWEASDGITLRARAVTINQAVGHIPQITLEEEQARKTLIGISPILAGCPPAGGGPHYARLIDRNGRLLAISRSIPHGRERIQFQLLRVLQRPE